MIPMKRVDSKHTLYLNTDTDKSHLFAVNDFKHENPLLTFDSSLNCFDASGKVIARIGTEDKNWVVEENDFSIKTTPVSMNDVEGVFRVEADFCKQWLALKKTN